MLYGAAGPPGRWVTNDPSPRQVPSFEEVGNALADTRANMERVAAVSTESEPFLTGEEMFTAWLADDTGRIFHIIGDVRKALRR